MHTESFLRGEAVTDRPWCAGDGKSCQLLWRYSSTGKRPQQASSQWDGTNRGQCLHREGLVEKEVAKATSSDDFQVISGEAFQQTEPNVDTSLSMYNLSPKNIHLDTNNLHYHVMLAM